MRLEIIIKRHIKFPDTPRFSKFYNEILFATDNEGRLKYANYDPQLGIEPTEEQSEKLKNYKPELPILKFIGSEKLHGENMAICYNQGELWVQGRNSIKTVISDQNGMAKFVEEIKLEIIEFMLNFSLENEIDLEANTLVFDCEWAGGNIQKGNAACSNTDKAVYLFDYARVVCNTTNNEIYVSTENWARPELNIYNLKAFKKYELTLNLNNPDECEKSIQDLAEYVEENSPIAKYFGQKDNVGEGIYLYTTYNNQLFRLKAKGEKHGGKPKALKKQNEKLDNKEKDRLIALAHKITPVWRITQGIKEVNATKMEQLGTLIGWVIKDIKKEEDLKVIEELKYLSSYVSNIVKDYYFDFLKGY